MPCCCLGLGGNTGDVAATFRSALRQLADSGHPVLATSQLYATAPVGPEAGDVYHNACALLETSLSPWGLLDAIHELEDTAGRDRSVRWGARTLDVDILTYDELVLNDPLLMLPHPGLVYRRFVLDPLIEIAPSLLHPVLGRSIEELQRRLLDRPLRIVIRGGNGGAQDRLVAELVRRFAFAIQVDGAIPVGSSIDFTLIDLDLSSRRREYVSPRAVVVHLDAELAQREPLAAAVAVVTAMLDEPQVVGALSWTIEF